MLFTINYKLFKTNFKRFNIFHLTIKEETKFNPPRDTRNKKYSNVCLYIKRFSQMIYCC